MTKLYLEKMLVGEGQSKSKQSGDDEVDKEDKEDDKSSAGGTKLGRNSEEENEEESSEDEAGEDQIEEDSDLALEVQIEYGSEEKKTKNKKQTKKQLLSHMFCVPTLLLLAVHSGATCYQEAEKEGTHDGGAKPVEG